MLVADGAFYAAYLVARKLGVPVYGVGAGPTPAPTSPTAPPPFFGLVPATNPVARLKHRVVRAMVERTTRPGMRAFNALLADEGLPAYERSVFDLPWDAATLFFQTGTPGMDFPRTDWPENHRFVGPLLPPRTTRRTGAAVRGQARRASDRSWSSRRARSTTAIPASCWCRRSPRSRAPSTSWSRAPAGATPRRCASGSRQDNVVVEDWVDFDVLLPRADVFVCNGGYGSIMQALMSDVPIVSAGKLEAKNDINARLAYRGFGLDLKTERPKPGQIAAGVTRVLGDPSFKENVARVSAELKACRPLETMEPAIVAAQRTEARE